MKINLGKVFSKSVPADDDPLVLDQQVINDNQEIHMAIKDALRSASQEILIAAAWFTDGELFEVVRQKIEQNVKVEIVLSDNTDNARLPFDELNDSGAVVYRIRNVGYGIMNQKFCIIDRRQVLHGTYNWSMNARKNNHESIIVTNHEETVASLIKTFEELKIKAKDQGLQTATDEGDSKDSIQPREERVTSQQRHTDTSFASVLDSMIAAEVASFDRSMLRQQGYDRAESNNGDHQVLHKSLDTVYSLFIHDIDVIDDKKRRLLAKVEEQRIKAIDTSAQQADLFINRIKANTEATKQQLESRVVNNSATISVNEDNISLIQSKIKHEESQYNTIEQNIRTEKLAFVRPAHRYFELVPLSALGLLLLCYLFIFYSSAAYIMIYSAADAEKNQMLGNLEMPEVFNPHALTDAWQKGTTAFLFVTTFVLVPLILAILPKIAKFSGWKDIATWAGILLVDAIIAYQVASVVHHVRLLRGDITEKWKFTDVFSDGNFYLVFILGALGLVLFKFIYAKFIGYYEERNVDHAAIRSKALIQEYEKDLRTSNDTLSNLKEESNKLQQSNVLLRAENQLFRAEIEQGPALVAVESERVKIELSQKQQYLQQTADLYISHIENDNLPISLDSLKDRINIFLEGWNDFLHDEYSVARAVEMSMYATQSVNQWQDSKLVNKTIDSRVKI